MLSGGVALGLSFFPRTDAGQFVINLKAPSGTKLSITEDEVVFRFDDRLYRLHRAEGDAECQPHGEEVSHCGRHHPMDGPYRVKRRGRTGRFSGATGPADRSRAGGLLDTTVCV